jgi:hypothetical protein
METIGANDDSGALHGGNAVAIVTADAGDAAILDHDLVDDETFPDLDATFGCGIKQQLVQDRSAWRIGDRTGLTAGTRRPGDLEWSQVERVRMYRGTSCAHEAIEYAPARERIDPWGMQKMRGHGVAWKRRTVDNQNLVALAREQHGRR